MTTPSVNGGVASGTVGGLVRVSTPNTMRFTASVAIGASGAATVSQGGAAYLTCVKSTTGTYDVTFPPFAASATSICLPHVWVIKSAAVTVAKGTIIAFSPTAGTLQFTTSKDAAGTPVEPASGDILGITIEGAKTGSAF